MRLIVGLRNPGSEYQGSRHNLGYEVLVALAGRVDAKLKRGPLRVRSEVAAASGRDLVLASPNTFMNDSGRAVASLRAYYKVDAGEMLNVAEHCRHCPGHSGTEQLATVQRSVATHASIVCRHGYVVDSECALKSPALAQPSAAAPAFR